PRCRHAGGDNGRNGDFLATLAPLLNLVDDLFHAACLRSIPPRTLPRLSRLATSWPARKRSTYGSAARMPPASGSYSACPLSGFTQTTANACRASRCICVPASCASPRSQPSERITTTAPRVIERRPHSSLYAFS